MTTDQVLSGVGLIIVLAVGSQVLASRLRIPAIIILLPAGFIAGALTTDVNPQQLLGAALMTGAILVVSGPTVVAPLLRFVRPTERLRQPDPLRSRPPPRRRVNDLHPPGARRDPGRERSAFHGAGERPPGAGHADKHPGSRGRGHTGPARPGEGRFVVAPTGEAVSA